MPYEEAACRRPPTPPSRSPSRAMHVRRQGGCRKTIEANPTTIDWESPGKFLEGPARSRPITSYPNSKRLYSYVQICPVFFFFFFLTKKFTLLSSSGRNEPGVVSCRQKKIKSRPTLCLFDSPSSRCQGRREEKKISRLCDDGSCVFFSLRDSLFVFNLVGSVLFSRLWDADGMP